MFRMTEHFSTSSESIEDWALVRLPESIEGAPSVGLSHGSSRKKTPFRMRLMGSYDNTPMPLLPMQWLPVIFIWINS